VLWYGELLEATGDLVQVQPLSLEPGSDSKTIEMLTEGTESGAGGYDGADSLSLPHSDSASIQSVSAPSLPLNASGASDLGSTIPSPEELITDMVIEQGDTELVEKVEVGSAAMGTGTLSLPNAPSSSSSSHHNSSLKRCIPRSSLISLDDDILHMYCTHKATSQLFGALLDFAEWDDHLRQSYVWSERMEAMMM
jgi:hypothetical protein